MARKMKDSGIEWIGEIPEDWETTRIGSLYSLRNTKVSDIDYPPLSVTMNGILPQLETAAKTNDHNNRKLVKKDDFVINSRSDRRGSCGISKYDGSVSLINIVLSPNETMNPEYYNWVFTNPSFSDEFYKWGNGIVDDLRTTNWSKMKNIDVPHPNLEVQEKITYYLNNKISSIDYLLIKINDEIEKLENYKKSLITEAVTKGLDKNVEMKDSGIEWIGEIPKHWKVIKIKNAALLKARIGWQGLKSDEFLTDSELPYLVTGTDFYSGLVDWENCVRISEKRFEMDKNIQIKENDLLITKDGTIGKLAIAKNCPEKASLNSGVFVIRNQGPYKYIDKYMYYLLQSEQFYLWFELNDAGNSTIRHLYQRDFYNFSFTYPDINEQEKIVDFLNKKTKLIDQTISLKQKQLQSLEEYKKSLIYEYVTGKKEV